MNRQSASCPLSLHIRLAYRLCSFEHGQRRVFEEKGPFGKARKRDRSRSKTATPGRKDDQTSLDNQRYIDSLFTERKESFRARRPSVSASSVPVSASAPNLQEMGVGAQTAQMPAAAAASTKEPTEVIVYGYGTDLQWAAIEHYERISNGCIFEDYERYPPSSKYNLSLSAGRAASMRNLPQAAIRKCNEYVGGQHWIKITFDSPEAAERAIHYSPQVIKGYSVKAERYRGQGPAQDAALPASGGTSPSPHASPLAASSSTVGASGASQQSSATLTEATARAPVPSFLRQQSAPVLPNSFPESPIDLRPPTHSTNTAAASTGARPMPARPSTLRVRGAKPAVLLPAKQAFLPAPPWYQQRFGSWPVIGWIIGSGHGIIGDQVPRKDDGSFDSDTASVYWKFWYMIDTCLGSNFCGIRGDEED